MGSWVWGLGFGVWGWGLGVGVWWLDAGCRGSGVRDPGLGLGVGGWGLGVGDLKCRDWVVDVGFLV